MGERVVHWPLVLINCRPRDDVIIPQNVSTADAKKKFGEVREVNP